MDSNRTKWKNATKLITNLFTRRVQGCQQVGGFEAGRKDEGLATLNESTYRNF